MKRTKQQFNNSNITHKVCAIVICTLLVCALLFSFAACSKHSYSPSDYETEPSETGTQPINPTPDNPPAPTQEELVQAFLSGIEISVPTNATTTITVSFGDRILSQKTIQYTLTENGGTVKTTLVSLSTADAKNPYETQKSTETLNATAYKNNFPSFKLTFDYSSLKNPQLVTNDNLTALNFAIDKANIVSIVNLSATDAQNIASDVEFIITASSNPQTISAKYVTSNGNTVEIVVNYSGE